MSVKTSTGLAAHLAVSGSLKEAFDGGKIVVYGGSIPSGPDSAASATVLWTISVDGDGTGLTYAPAAIGRALAKPDAVVWAGSTAAGTATHFRILAPGDTGAASTTERRIQGVVGTVAGSDMYMSSAVLTTNSSLTAKVLVGFSLTTPES